MKFYFAGGAMEVGGSCIHLQIAGKGILMDCGIRQSGNREAFPDFRGIQERGGVDAILISHAHMDHTGSLPVISKAYPAARIYMTKMAMEQTRVLLFDSLKLMDRREEEIPQYSREDVLSMLERITPIAYQQEMPIPELNMKVTAYPAGHIAGAACLYLQTEEGSIFYSGDVSGFAQQTIEGIGIPKLRPDAAILESTYGNRLHASRSLEEARLVETVADCARKGMKVLIPSFALGRSQEVLLILRKAMGDGKIPHIPVYVDGMVRDMNRVYAGNPTFLRRGLAKRILKGEDPFYTDDIRAVQATEDRDTLVNAPGAAVFVSSSGMLSGGPSVLYAQKLLPREDACIILTGYQDEESPGRKLMDLVDEAWRVTNEEPWIGMHEEQPQGMHGEQDQETDGGTDHSTDPEQERRVTLDKVTVPVKARTVMVGLSAHADQSELCGIIERISARRVILVHGDEDAVRALGEQLSSDVRRQIYQPSVGEEVAISIGTKRTQLTSGLPMHMNCTTFDGDEDVLRLWDFVRMNYSGRAFTVQELAYLWYGNTDSMAEDRLQAFQEKLLGSLFFDRHARRLYLLVPCTEEEIREKRRVKEPSPQDVEAVVRELAQGGAADSGEEIEIKKLGFYPEEKRVVLTVDFPDVLSPERISEMKEALRGRTGWELSVKPTMNFASAGMLLESLFPQRILKSSYFTEKKYYQVTLSEIQADDAQSCERFCQKTGWRLVITNLGTGSTVYGHPGGKTAPCGNATRDEGERMWFYPQPGQEKAEQNFAFSLIDMAFAESEIKPYKKGRKNDIEGLYLELSFLSPALGIRCSAILEEVARQIGWRLHISESVNQNQLQMIAAQMCAQYGVTQKKAASYLPAQRSIRIQNLPDTPVPAKMKEDFLERTGVPIVE